MGMLHIDSPGLARSMGWLVAAVVTGCAAQRPGVQTVAGGDGVFAHGAVAADHAIASLAGARMLALGGNAIDAAVAASFTLSVVRPFSCGIGGGGFMVIALADGRSAAINYREMCPAGAGPEFFERQQDPEASTRGGAACAVPGTVAGLLYALEHFGTLDRATVLAPAIQAARDGFTVDRAYMDEAGPLIEKFARQPQWQSRFAFVWERFLREGRVRVDDVIRLPEQAEALELISREGAPAFYGGEIGRAITKAAAQDHGVLSLADLRNYRVQQLEPLRTGFLGRATVLSMPPPSSGGVAMAQALGILGRLKIDEVAAGGDSGLYVHLVSEAFKHAFADRAEWLADPTKVDVPVQRLLSDRYLDERAAMIDPARTFPSEHYGTRRQAGPDGGTSHLSVVDQWGGAVACTETINLEFGSLLAVARFGFCLNDEMDDFTARRGRPNAFGLTQSDRNLPAPGKRPLSSMSPTIVLDVDGRVLAVAGGSGGPRIITATTQVLLDVLLLHLSAPDAVGRPRFHHQWIPDELLMEQPWLASPEGQQVAAALRARGHTVKPTRSIAVVQLIRRIGPIGGSAGWEAACDPRKGGSPAGH